MPRRPRSPAPTTVRAGTGTPASSRILYARGLSSASRVETGSENGVVCWLTRVTAGPRRNSISVGERTTISAPSSAAASCDIPSTTRAPRPATEAPYRAPARRRRQACLSPTVRRMSSRAAASWRRADQRTFTQGRRRAAPTRSHSGCRAPRAEARSSRRPRRCRGGSRPGRPHAVGCRHGDRSRHRRRPAAARRW